MSSSSSEVTVTVSCPGKILLAGGYLVLERPNVGLVIAADKHFYTTVRKTRAGDRPREVENEVEPTDEERSAFAFHSAVDVHSPQYDAVFSYRLSYNMIDDDDDDDDEDRPAVRIVRRDPEQRPNEFVERTLVAAFAFLVASSAGSSASSSPLFPPVVSLRLRADNDFYSQTSALRERGAWPSPTPADVASLPPFLPAGDHKTGLGSSAALVTSLTGALVRRFGDVVGADKDERFSLVVHALAQTAHSWAQGKVGSGFDVSAACFGSHAYRRFSPSVLRDALDRLSSSSDGATSATARTLRNVATSTSSWDHERSPFSLPPGFGLVMADVRGGSESPGMARSVLRWRREYEETKQSRRDDDDDDDDYWESLKVVNDDVASLFVELRSLLVDDDARREELRALAALDADGWEAADTPLSRALVALREALLEARASLKAMGEVAGAPIEPDSQTALADATSDLPGVVAAGVPGAGGVDALYCVYLRAETHDDENENETDAVRESVCRLWGRWGDDRDDDDDDGGAVVCPMGVRAAGPGEGLRVVVDDDDDDAEW